MNNNVVTSDSGASSKILSIHNIDNAKSELLAYCSEVAKYLDDIRTVLKAFSNEEITKSFFESGTFGKMIYDELKKCGRALVRYEIATFDLKTETTQFLLKQYMLNTRGNKGGK